VQLFILITISFIHTLTCSLLYSLLPFKYYLSFLIIFYFSYFYLEERGMVRFYLFIIFYGEYQDVLYLTIS
jgi:hypothetical protein